MPTGQPAPSDPISDRLRTWVRSEYPDYPFAYFGLSGCSLLLDALRGEQRDTLILPAFICADLSAMALALGMRVVHVDVDRHTMHMPLDRLSASIVSHSSARTVLLVDHTFGYPFADIERLRTAHPGLLIIEDCVRALGAAVNGVGVGHRGDWVLLSMYKNTLGNDHGAILLTRTPCSIRSGAAPAFSWIQWASALGPPRRAYELLKRFRAEAPAAPRDLHTPSWTPVFGVPNRMVQRRFMRQVDGLAEHRKRREEAAHEIQHALTGEIPFQFVRLADAGRSASFFLSGTVGERVGRDALVTAMQRKGHFLAWAWTITPASYRCFATSFPNGASETMFLSDHVCHIPLWPYETPAARRQLTRAFRQAVDQVGR